MPNPYYIQNGLKLGTAFSVSWKSILLEVLFACCAGEIKIFHYVEYRGKREKQHFITIFNFKWPLQINLVSQQTEVFTLESSRTNSAYYIRT